MRNICRFLAIIYIVSCGLLSVKCYSNASFISIWDTRLTSSGSSAINQIHLPVVPGGGAYDFIVEWGDNSNNTITAYNSPYIVHSYNQAGIYSIAITGKFIGLYNEVDAQKLLAITQWGSLKFGNDGVYLNANSNLHIINASDAPDLSLTTSLALAFSYCTSLTEITAADLWDTTTITNMNGVFSYCTKFNSNLQSWNVGAVTVLESAFLSAKAFNSPLNTWRPSNVIQLGSMFAESGFDQPLDEWTGSLTHVQTIDAMFYSTPFNQDLTFIAREFPHISLLENFLADCPLSTKHYDDFLNELNKNLNSLPASQGLWASLAKYSINGQQSRQNLVNIKHWTIVDAGFDASNANRNISLKIGTLYFYCFLIVVMVSVLLFKG